MLNSLRFALRRLRRAPGFTLAAVLMLGVGAGVGTSIFSVINALVWKTTPGRPGDVRFAASTWARDFPGILGAEDVSNVTAHPPDALEWMVGASSEPFVGVRVLGTPMVVRVGAVAGSYFDAFGMRPLQGRALGAGADADDQSAVISEKFWRKLGTPANVLGSTAFVAGHSVVIVGVVEDRAVGVDAMLLPDIWVSSHVVAVRQLFGRLKPDVSLDQANAEIRARYPSPTESEPGRTLEVREGFSTPISGYFILLMTGTTSLNAIVIVLAAASVTLMWIARLLSSRGDIGIRLMLGATVSHIVHVWAAEVALVGLAAGCVGVVLSAWVSRAVLVYLASTSGLPIDRLNVTPDWRVGAYVIGLTAVAVGGIIVALAGQVATMTTMTSTSMAAGIGGVTPRDVKVRGRLISAQVAVATCLLLLAAFFYRMAVRETGAELGFDPSRVVVARLDQTGADRELVLANNRRALKAAERTRGVSAAALTTGVLGLSGTGARSLASVRRAAVSTSGVTPGFFDAVPLAVRRGRGLAGSDVHDGAPVAVISELTASTFWAHEDPVGQSLWLDGRNGATHEVRVIGVVQDARFSDSGARPRPVVYLPYEYVVGTMHFGWDAVLLMRGSAPSPTLISNLRSTMATDAPEAGVTFVGTVQDKLAADRGPAAVSSQMLLALGGLLLTLAIGGLYGLTSYLATQRHREFGIRKALGASGGRLMLMVAREGLAPLAWGTLIGAGAALVIAVWLRARQFHSLDLVDPMALVAIVGALGTATLIGTILPFATLIRREASAMLREG